MILTVDIGNTCTKLALFDLQGRKLKEKTFSSSAYPLEEFQSLAGTTKAVIASVVPRLTDLWRDILATAKISQVEVCDLESKWGFTVEVENPQTVGIDRLANCEGALRFEGNVIIVDAGTATKIDLLEGMRERRFVGGAIAPGVILSYENLLEKTAQLPPIDLEKRSPVIGYNTDTAIRSGVVHGCASMVDGMILRILEERNLPRQTCIVATGGNVRFLKGNARFITHFAPSLTEEGLYAIAQKS